jgi:hypothetical protein
MELGGGSRYLPDERERRLKLQMAESPGSQRLGKVHFNPFRRSRQSIQRSFGPANQQPQDPLYSI